LDEDTFTASGTWTKAAGYEDDDTVMVFLIGAGGAGGAARVNLDKISALGGYAGSTLVLTGRYGDVSTSSFTLTLGAGGAATTRSTDGATSGNAGGNSILQSSNSYFVAGGGAGGLADLRGVAFN
jgi:hypothetical protein